MKEALLYSALECRCWFKAGFVSHKKHIGLFVAEAGGELPFRLLSLRDNRT